MTADATRTVKLNTIVATIDGHRVTVERIGDDIEVRFEVLIDGSERGYSLEVPAWAIEYFVGLELFTASCLPKKTRHA